MQSTRSTFGSAKTALEADLVRFARSFDVDADPEVERVRRLQPVGQDAAHRRQRLRRKIGELQPALDHQVGRDHAERAAGGGDADALAAGLGQHGERAQGVEEVGLVLRAHDAVLAQRAVEHLVVGGERAGVRGGGACAFLGAAGLSSTIGLSRRTSRRLLQELARIANALDVKADHLGAADRWRRN